MDYAYDLGGNSTTQTYPSGRTVTVSYDDAGRIDGVTGQKTGEANRTYASDFAFVTTALLPHGATWMTPGMQVASLDHVMWFHRPFRVDEWLLYDMESPTSHAARGFAMGNIFSANGDLVVSVVQEGLIRPVGG